MRGIRTSALKFSYRRFDAERLWEYVTLGLMKPKSMGCSRLGLYESEAVTP